MPVPVVHWNPVKPITRADGTVGPAELVNNFGDLIGPVLVERVLQHLKLTHPVRDERRLVAVGSILHFANEGDTVWGAGVNGKKNLWAHHKTSPTLDVRSVRGPRTRDRLLEWGNPDVPAVFGDPALLWAKFWPRKTYKKGGPRRNVVIVPNLNDWPIWGDDPRAIDPRADVQEVAGHIARADFVCGSSLHGMVLADSFGIPSRPIASDAEPSLKYEDYYGGTGGRAYEPASSVAEAIRLGGVAKPRWSDRALLKAFPRDLFQKA